MSTTTSTTSSNLLEEPIMDNELDRHLYKKFDELIDTVNDTTFLWTDEMAEADDIAAYERLHERIQVEVNTNPIISRTISSAFLHWSLLTTACEKLQHIESHPIIRFLIEKDPSALLWKCKFYQDIENSSPIYIISRHHIHCVLMPWIAKHFPWVLDHPDCQERPPIFFSSITMPIIVDYNLTTMMILFVNFLSIILKV